MNSYDILREPVITERSMEQYFDRQGNEIHKYTFKVPEFFNIPFVCNLGDNLL